MFVGACYITPERIRAAAVHIPEAKSRQGFLAFGVYPPQRKNTYCILYRKHILSKIQRRNLFLNYLYKAAMPLFDLILNGYLHCHNADYRFAFQAETGMFVWTSSDGLGLFVAHMFVSLCGSLVGSSVAGSLWLCW